MLLSVQEERQIMSHFYNRKPQKGPSLFFRLVYNHWYFLHTSLKDHVSFQKAWAQLLKKRVGLIAFMLCLNFRAFFSQNVSGPIQEQNQNKQAVKSAHLTLLPKITNYFLARNSNTTWRLSTLNCSEMDLN